MELQSASGPSNAAARTAGTIAEEGTSFAIPAHAVQMKALQQPADARFTAQRQRYLTSRVSPAAIEPAELAMRWQELLARSRREVTPSRWELCSNQQMQGSAMLEPVAAWQQAILWNRLWLRGIHDHPCRDHHCGQQLADD